MPAPLNLSNTPHLILRDIRRECPNFTADAFADHVGVTASTVCRWGKPTSDHEAAPMPVYALEALADFTGRPDVVYRRLLAARGLMAVRAVSSAGGLRDVARGAAELSQATAALTVDVMAAGADGYDLEERLRLTTTLRELAQRVADLQASLAPASTSRTLQ